MAAIDTIGGGNIEPRGLEEEMRSAYLDYAMSVIVGRALPDVRDGLKPVHRRVLYAMNELGLRPTRKHVKCAPIVGEVMGKYHPHGDSAIYDTLARMAQDFSMRYPLVDGHGQLRQHRRLRRGRDALHRGPPRPRWPPRCCATSTPRRSTSRPTTTAPSRSRSCCPRGSRTCWSTAAPGSPSAWRPTSRRTTCARWSAATIAYIDDPEIDVDGLMQHIKGPDFPTAGTILGREGIRDAYATGRGRVRVQAKAHIEPIGQGKEAIIVTELPYQVRKGGDGGLIEKIARSRPREEAHRDHRHPRRVRPPRDADRDRAQARRDPEGRAQQAVQAHADAADLRREHGRARRQRAAHAVAARGDRPLRRPPARGHRPPHASTSCAAPRSARTCSRAC